MDIYNQAANYSLFKEARAYDGAFASNQAERVSLQEAVQIQPFQNPEIVRFRPKNNGLFRTANDYMVTGLPYKNTDNNLTHNKFSDGSVMPYQLMSMGHIRSGAGLDRAHAISIGTTELEYHNFQDLHFTRDNKTAQ